MTEFQPGEVVFCTLKHHDKSGRDFTRSVVYCGMRGDRAVIIVETPLGPEERTVDPKKLSKARH